MQMAAPLAEHFNVDYASVEDWPLDRLLKANLRLTKHLSEKRKAQEEAMKGN